MKGKMSEETATHLIKETPLFSYREWKCVIWNLITICFHVLDGSDSQVRTFKASGYFFMPILGKLTLIFVTYDRSLTLGLLSATLEKRGYNLSEPFSPPGIALEIRKELTFSTGSVINSHELYHKSQSKLSDSIWIFPKRFFNLTCLFLPKSAPPLVLPISVTLKIRLHVGWWGWLKKKDGEQSQTPRSSCLVLVTLKNTVTYDK